MFWSKNKKNRYTPAYPSFAIYNYIKVGFKGVFISRTCFPDACFLEMTMMCAYWSMCANKNELILITIVFYES